MSKRSPRLQFTEEERATPELQKAIKNADKAADKLDKAEAKIPKKTVVKMHGSADVDTVVARYNVRAYQSGQLETVDVSHLGSLSYSAVPYLQELTEDDNPEIAQMATDILNRKARFLNEEEDLRSWNYEKVQAMEILKAYRQTETAER